MGVRELTVFVSTVAFCAMGAIPGAGQGAVCCDVNGDHHVDVLDVQTVIGTVLAAGMPDGLTDVKWRRPDRCA